MTQRGVPEGSTTYSSSVTGARDDASARPRCNHTFTPHDSRGQNWAGGTWWITEKVAEDAGVCGGGTVCDGQGDGPCDCDPCPACNGAEIARGGTEEDLMQEVPQTFTVPAPDYLVAAFGPGCGRRDRYQDFNKRLP